VPGTRLSPRPLQRGWWCSRPSRTGPACSAKWSFRRAPGFPGLRCGCWLEAAVTGLGIARGPGGQVRVLRRGVFKISPRQNNDAIPISKTGSGAKRSSGATLPPAPHASGQVFDSIRTLEGWTIPAGASERSRARQRQSRMPYRRMEALPDLGENRENMQIARRKDKRCFVGSTS
jgi:hypothetical protein